MSRICRSLIAAAVVLVASVPGVGAEDISAKKLLIKDHFDPARRQLQVQSADLGVQFVEADAPNINGASVHAYSATDAQCIILGGGPQWQQKNGVWKYNDKTTKRRAQISDGKLSLKIRSGVTYSLNESSQGAVNVQVQFGDAGARYCMRCDAPTTDDDRRFQAKQCASVACDPEPPGCFLAPTTTTSTTTTTTTTTSTTSTTIVGSPNCPNRMAVEVLAGTGAACSTNAECAPRICAASGRCEGPTQLDLGWTGNGHDTDANDGSALLHGVACPGPGPVCGECVVSGVVAETRLCRCANDTRAICDQPFASDADDCAGNACRCYAGAPLPISVGNTPICLTRRLRNNISGTVDVDDGSSEISTRLDVDVYIGQILFAPCPVCGGTCTAPLASAGDPCGQDIDCDSSDGAGDGACSDFDAVANDGVRDGTCWGGANHGQICDVQDVNATFPAPGNDGGHSLDCYPSPGANVSGAGLKVDLLQTTGTSLLAAEVLCGFPPAVPLACPCGTCSADTTRACSSNADCTGAGTCGPSGPPFGATLRNNCSDGICNPTGNAEGECNLPEPDRFCDAVTRANGEGFIWCTANADCALVNIGIDAGACELSKQRECFLDPIEATGVADTDTPVEVAAGCIPPLGSSSLNTIFGFAGPARVISQSARTVYCASNPANVYVPGVGCP